MSKVFKAFGLILFGTIAGWLGANYYSDNTMRNINLDSLCHGIYKQIEPAKIQDTISYKLKHYGLVNIQDIDSTIRVKLIYATPKNFTQTNLYGSLSKAYLEPGFATKVARAQKILKSTQPSYTLLIWDAARPISVQRKMRKVVEGTGNEKYVANGDRGGRHNYGVAVDLTIADGTGQPLDMGTPFDYFGEAAHVGNEADLVKAGIITANALQNRQLLYKIMKEVDLVPYHREWWHYEEPIPMTNVRNKYKLLNF